MPIGSDVVSGMLNLFDEVMSVPKTGKQQLQQAIKTYDIEDIQQLAKSPEAEKTHSTTNWMQQVLGGETKPAGVSEAKWATGAEPTPQKSTAFKQPYVQPPTWLEEI